MNFSLYLCPDMPHYYIIDHLDLSDAELDSLIASLPSWRREEALRYRHRKGRVECALSYSLLQRMLQEHYGIRCSEPFLRGNHGKPLLPHHPSLRFNLSHCRHAIACVVSDHGEVGIDVECLGRYKPSLAEYTMSDEELAEIDSATDPDLAFTILWTRKEALLKYTGEGITDDMKTCLTSPRAKGVTIESGYDKEHGYAWSLAY